MTAPELPLIEVSLEGRLGDFELSAELRAPASGVTALVGPSGCGKTTLLRCLSGVCRLAGRVSFEGQVWQDGRRFVAPHRRPVGYVFQEASLFPHLSVRRNLAFGLSRTPAAHRLSLDEAVDLLDLARLLDRNPSKLSGGERQRVAIARALLVQPRLLLLDEPVSSVDAASKAEILGHLEHINAQLAIPMIYVSHDPAEVARLAHRVLAMDAGRIVSAPRAGVLTQAEALAAVDKLSPEQVRGLAAAALQSGLKPDRSSA
jgi:molybdate transport system ATP-binding protein